MTTLREILNFLGSETQFKLFGATLDSTIEKPSNLCENNSVPFLIFWVNDKNVDKIKSIRTGIVISPQLIELDSFNGAIILCDRPRKAFMDVVRKFFYEDHQTHTDSCIGQGNFIDDDVKIGDRVRIGHNNVIHKGTIIGDDVSIGSNNTIGGVGFGYELDENGDYELIPHIGGVVIERNVEIGNNNCIDRAVLGNTIIGENCKIDNLVHIAHGVKLGNHSLVIANSMIAGSVIIGERCWIAPSTSIINSCTIGSDSMTGIGSVVLKSVEDFTLVAGVPAKKLRDLCVE